LRVLAQRWGRWVEFGGDEAGFTFGWAVVRISLAFAQMREGDGARSKQHAG
jgi:hypothetical protein